jgi:hypothetical protein
MGRWRYPSRCERGHPAKGSKIQSIANYDEMISKFRIPLKFISKTRGFDGQVYWHKAQGLLDLLSRAINCPERDKALPVRYAKKGNAIKVSRLEVRFSKTEVNERGCASGLAVTVRLRSHSYQWIIASARARHLYSRHVLYS